jgi:hypothetical protein
MRVRSAEDFWVSPAPAVVPLDADARPSMLRAISALPLAASATLQAISSGAAGAFRIQIGRRQDRDSPPGKKNGDRHRASLRLEAVQSASR